MNTYRVLVVVVAGVLGALVPSVLAAGFVSICAMALIVQSFA